MAKILEFDEKARRSLERGVNQLADVVKALMKMIVVSPDFAVIE